ARMTPRRTPWICALALLTTAAAAAQTITPPPSNAELSAQIQQLRAALAATQAQLAQEQAALGQLEAKLAAADDQQTIANGKIDDGLLIVRGGETKVESGSQSRLTLSGLLLMYFFNDTATTEN